MQFPFSIDFLFFKYQSNHVNLSESLNDVPEKDISEAIVSHNI